MVVLVVVSLWGHDLTSRVGAAYRTDPVRPARTVTAGTLVDRRRIDLVLGASLGRTAVGLLFLGDRHRRRRLAGLVQLQLAQLLPTRVGFALVMMLRPLQI